MSESSTTRPSPETDKRDRYGRPLNDQGFAALDKQGVENAVHDFLFAIGEDPEREGLKGTPERVARATQELMSGMYEVPQAHLERQFDEEDDGLVVVRDIPFTSFCEHHILPFVGAASIVYLPRDGKIVGLSKMGRLVEGYAHRLQVQERLTHQIADAVMEELNPQGVLVVLRATHSCMVLRGIKSTGSTTVTSAVKGCLAKDPDLRQQALLLISLPKNHAI